MGQSLPVSRQVAEVAALCEALNVVSQRLLEQHTELSNQKAAMDEHAIVSVTDLAGNILYANQRFCDISGYTQAELLGQNHRLLKSGAHENAFYADMWHTISGGRVWHGEIKNRKKDGGFFWVQATIVPLADATGAPYRFIGIRTDITTNKLLEANLADARDRAEAATLAKSQFLANMSHEIRTPMNAILGMLRLLQNTELTRRQHDYATKAEGAAQSLLGLLNDILDFSKMEAGKMVLEERPFRLDKLMRDISVIVAANVGSKPVEVLFDIDPSAPKALLGDAMRLQQVLINLCGNAVKFTQRGEVLVRIGVRQRSDHAAELQFSVRDTGIGIAPDNLERIFEGFSQAEASTTRRFGGTGLGLNISKRLVALMGGKLGVTSELGKGSTFSFTVTLPIGAVTESASAHPKPAQDLRVLVVDDNPTAREILAGMVQSLGWTADLAADGTQALALMRAHLSPGQQPYQAVFVDWQMPGMDGWETVQAMRQIESEQAPPIVVMVTAHGREMLSQRSAQEQAQLHGFLVKPVTASMLHDAVADALSNRLAPRASVPAPQRDLPLAGLRLLVVEDNLINQQVAREMLSHEGAEVVLAENGQLGVDAVCSALEGGRGFDAVLMDIQMPVMDGYTATRVLRQEVGLAQLPIIAMTANAMASDREACLAAGMNEHIGKPFQIADLVRLLRAMTKQAQPPTAPVQPKLPVSAPPEPALPPVDAVDVDGALERLGGNRALFHKVLASYLAELAGQPAALEQALAQADLTPAVRLLHTLKGLSATVGASFMAAVARQAETAVKAVQAGPSPQADATQLNRTALVAQVRAAVLATQGVLNQVMQSLEGNTAPAAHPATAGQIASTAAAEADEWAQLRLLQVLLASADMQALEAFEALEAQARSIPPDALEALRQAMAVFDFASAAQVCEALLQGQVRQN
jgi:PAS domain S-box-containing protein